MKRSDVLTTLGSRQAEIKALGVKSLALFGSVARDEASAESDVDLLLEFEGPGTFDRYVGLKLFLEDLLGCRVDLVMRKALRNRLRSAVERELVRVA